MNREPVNLERVAADYRAAKAKSGRRVVICGGTGCIANGALKVQEEFLRQIAAAGLPVTTELRAEAMTGKDHPLHVSQSGCQGFCQMGPLVTILPVALLALVPIWLYRGRQGYHSKPFQYACYAFYPVHMLLLVLMR